MASQAPTGTSTPGHFVVVEPARTSCDYFARALVPTGALRMVAIGTRRGTAGVPLDITRLNPAVGLVGYVCSRTLSMYRGEAARFHLLPWFDRWARRLLQPGDHVISTWGFANECFKFAHRHGGKTFIDAGNSHIENFWEIISEEHRRWKCPTPPFSPFWYKRSRAMLAELDYVLSPSAYVTQSFLSRGFKPEQVLRNVYPVDLSLFQPPTTPRPKDRPLTVLNAGNLSLRKGSPYLLEAFRLVRQRVPSARLLLTTSIRDDMKPLLAHYRDLPIEWASSVPHAQLADRLREGDVFVQPSLEEGLVRTVIEAMACGLPVVVTPNCGANDFVQPGVNGEIVPIRHPKATAEAILKCWERLCAGERPTIGDLRLRLCFETFAGVFLAQLRGLGLIPAEPSAC